MAHAPSCVRAPGRSNDVVRLSLATPVQSQVDISNQLAAQRADDNPVLNIIRDIRQDIDAGQSRVEDRLDEILGRQTRCVRAGDLVPWFCY